MNERGFAVVPIVISRYSDGKTPLNEAEEYMSSIAGMLESMGGDLDEWIVADRFRTRDAVAKRLKAWARPDEPRSSILVWLGHGQTTQLEPWLSTSDSTNPIEGIAPHDLLAAILQEWAGRRADGRDEWAIVVVEACGA